MKGRRMAKAATKKKRKPRGSDKRQSQRFIEAAGKLDAEKKGKFFEEVFSKLVPPKGKRAG